MPAVQTGSRVQKRFINSKAEDYRAIGSPGGGMPRYEAMRSEAGADVYSDASSDFIVGSAFLLDAVNHYLLSVHACNKVEYSAWLIGV